MDIKYWKAVAALGVPGLALGAFYKLYDKFDWPLKNLPPDLVFWLVLAFMVLIAAIVLFTLFLWRPKPEVKAKDGQVSITFPKGCTFSMAARAIAGDRLVALEGFTKDELESPVQARQITATDAPALMALLREISTRKIRPYHVSLSDTGKYIARVL